MKGGTETKQRERKEGQKPTKENGRRDRKQTKRMKGGAETKQRELKEGYKPNKENGRRDRNEAK